MVWLFLWPGRTRFFGGRDVVTYISVSWRAGAHSRWSWPCITGGRAFPVRRGLPVTCETVVCARSLGWHACPLADHEPGQRDEAGCGEQFLAQVVLDGVPDLFLGAQAVLEDL